MTIESVPPKPKKDLLQETLLNIAAEIDVPRNNWEQVWVDVARSVGITPAEIEAAAAKKRPKLIDLPR